MLPMIAILPIVVINTAMITVVWMGYRQQRSGRFLIATVIIQMLIAIAASERRTAISPDIVVVASACTWVLLALLSLALLLFFAALYVPEWWQQRRTITWIGLPYLGAIALISLSIILSTGWLIQGVEEAGGGYIQIVPGPLRWLASIMFALSWLPHIVLLTRTFIYQPKERQSMLVLIAALIFSAMIGSMMRDDPVLSQIASALNHLVLIGALGYLLLRRKIFEASQVVMDQALAGMAEGVAVLAPDETARFANRAMEQYLGLRQGHSLEAIGERGFDVAGLRALLRSERLEAILETADQAVAITASPIIGNTGEIQGHLLLARDVTQARAYEHTLQQRQAELLQTVEELQKAQVTQQSLAETVRELSLPIIPVAHGVIVMPLIGTLNDQRASDFEERFLHGIQQHHAHTAVLDLTGVPPIDQAAASILMRAVGGAKLLGAQTILVGIRPEVAQSIVTLGLRQAGFTTALTLQDALDVLLHQDARPANGKIHAG